MVPEVAFLILHAGPAVTVAQQGLLNVEHELRAYGFPASEIEAALAYQKLDDDFTRTSRGWTQLQDVYHKAEARKAEWVSPPRAAADWFRRFYRGVMDFDPTPCLETLHCPVLAFFGEADVIVPPEPNRGLLEKALRKAGNQDVTIVVLPKANHVFLKAQTGVRTEIPSLDGFVLEYFQTMAAWLRRRSGSP
jgi:pimeloyl-ACP methyl ester carboxylesterase